MVEPVRLSARDARRVAVRAQLLAADRPTDLLETVRHLTMVQLDPTAAVAPNAELVTWSRLGAAAEPGGVETLLEEGRLVEHDMRAIPAEDVALLRDAMARWPSPSGEVVPWREEIAEWVADNDECRRDLLERLRGDGPLAARALPDTCVRPWGSSGWTNGKNVQRMLGFMSQRGEVAVAAREGRDRLWDLAERVYPDVPAVPYEEAERRRDARRLTALGIARPRATFPPGEPNHVNEAGVPAVVDGVRGRWRVDPALLEGRFRGRTAILSPLDRLVFDRKRMTELFGFDYQLEMYKPAAARKWGYFALPVLHGDRLVGKVDAAADRPAGVLRVHAVHEDEPFSPTLARAVERELRDLATWLGLGMGHHGD